MTYKFSELCDKEVINCATATCIGVVTDVIINSDEGRVEGLIVSQNGGFSFKKEPEICIPWEKIDKIGDDFIITSGFHVRPEPFKDGSSAGHVKKFFFSK